MGQERASIEEIFVDDEITSKGMAIFIAPLMIPLLIYFAKRAWDEASFQFSVKQEERSQADREVERASTIAADALITK